MLLVEFKKTMCRPVDLMGQGPPEARVKRRAGLLTVAASLGGMDGGSPCHMAILRNGHVPRH